jgi:hypothetical protein
LDRPSLVAIDVSVEEVQLGDLVLGVERNRAGGSVWFVGAARNARRRIVPQPPRRTCRGSLKSQRLPEQLPGPHRLYASRSATEF